MRPLTTTVRTRSRESGREREREGDKFPPLAKVKGKVKEERESSRRKEGSEQYFFCVDSRAGVQNRVRDRKGESQREREREREGCGQHGERGRSYSSFICKSFLFRVTPPSEAPPTCAVALGFLGCQLS